MIVLVNADPSEPAELSPPLFQATVAAAMEYEVEIIITGRSAELARRGIAEQLRLPDGPQTVYGLMQDAHRAGVVFKVCAPAPGLGDEESLFDPHWSERSAKVRDRTGSPPDPHRCL